MCVRVCVCLCVCVCVFVCVYVCVCDDLHLEFVLQPNTTFSEVLSLALALHLGKDLTQVCALIRGQDPAKHVETGQPPIVVVELGNLHLNFVFYDGACQLGCPGDDVANGHVHGGGVIREYLLEGAELRLGRDVRFGCLSYHGLTCTCS
jgi:hypothetical protein